MTKLQIKEGNKLIASFMMKGGCLSTPSMHYSCDRPYNPKIDDICDNEDYKSFKYHSSWDWLMPVVEKIETLGYYTNIVTFTTDGKNTEYGFSIRKYDEEDYQYHNIPLRFTFGESKIKEVYMQLIEFIEWYNKNK